MLRTIAPWNATGAVPSVSRQRPLTSVAPNGCPNAVSQRHAFVLASVIASWACDGKVLTEGSGTREVGSGGEERGQRDRGTRDPGRRRKGREGRKGSQRAF